MTPPPTPGPPPRGRSAWGALVPVVALAAGLLFATSGQTAQGSDLRAGDVTELSTLVAQRDEVIAEQEAQLEALQRQAEALTDQAASRDGAVAAARAAGEDGALSAGLVAMSGPGVEITLDDAPRRPDGGLPTGARPDDVVIHQSDVQAVVNAVWAAGADGVAIMDQRLVATSAVRCVGNVLLLQGRTYSPPFVVTAIGDPAAIRTQLDASPQVQVFLQAVEDYGLGFAFRERPDLTLPGHDAPPVMEYATAADG
ncbi:DUF881 domain-containing protein [Geodermatophilus maliterrae]|uniref:DUF881 domain-containing protein n=1 Tax=Geodermatophilus maliterrae TaxID=3162531 RepID=A0ABV3XM95_9ACTN